MLLVHNYYQRIAERFDQFSTMVDGLSDDAAIRWSLVAVWNTLRHIRVHRCDVAGYMCPRPALNVV